MIETMTPPGVEHTTGAGAVGVLVEVIETMTPPGVEHLYLASYASLVAR